MTNAEIFINEFKNLENLLRVKFCIDDYSKSALKEIELLPQFRHLKEELKYIREIRNILQHKPQINGEYPIQPNKEIINSIKEIIEFINNPPKAYDKSIKINSICYASLEEKIYPYMQKMKENIYTHIPILQDGIVVGVFSENTLFGALLEDELVYEKEKTSFSDSLIRKYCSLDNHVTEQFCFIKKDMYLEDVKELFLKSFEQKHRLCMLFITQNGKRNEKLLGILTPWDVLGK